MANSYEIADILENFEQATNKFESYLSYIVYGPCINVYSSSLGFTKIGKLFIELFIHIFTQILLLELSLSVLIEHILNGWFVSLNINS